ncbi:type IV toxin-antitoxin system AbiEi family antitoxin domain-containing protein [Gordonia sp. OPL2]|uniref:type IV toxin-antitoxin system AbiEi family antitoxin domain-containing protein n=1 Tax=Gordonia sp. OPL2 TaxID=2486274 RepID=UPI0016560DA7|nr:type IV toxin-antitoxin system AbiEi family antitoxin domain-containing protein [Gordonia sp. OPL2]ROZ84126.1 DUF559 domain-containing protein [Gordonia sp. OPL2]
MNLPPGLRALALERDGVLTAADMRRHGLSRPAVQRRIEAGDLIRMAGRVYRVADHPLTLRARARVATLSVSPRAALCGRMAVWWHGIVDNPPPTITVTAPRGHHGAVRPGTVIIRRTLDPVDIVTHDGLRTTSKALSVLDAAVEGGMEPIDRGLQQGLVTVTQLIETFERRRKCVGATEMARMLALVDSGARSEAERLTVSLFRDEEITGWVANHPAEGYEIDFAFNAQMLAVEIDGLAFHRDAVTFQRDRTKRNALIAAGWTVLNFTWGDLVERREYVIAQVRRALSAAA